MQRIFSIDQLDSAAQWILNECSGKKIIAFHAEMGRGKTTLIRALCKQLGVEQGVSSPTFSIIQEYLGLDGLRIFHMDWYRLKNEEEAIEAGVEDVLRQSDAYVFVEWPEMALALLPSNALHVELEIMDETTRMIKIQSA
jgi:tRNA threonylcarbamoyladenosine biosynthesis protein TsaE